MFPIHLDFGFIHYHYYEGFYFLISIVIGYLFARRRFISAGLTDHPSLENHIFVALVFALLGAKLSDDLFWNFDSFIQNPLGLFLSPAGSSIVGGLYGGMFGGWVYSKVKGINYWPYFAAASPAILFAQAIGRIGCFLNGDAFGKATSLPWGVTFPRFGYSIPSFQLDTTASSFAWVWSFEQGLVQINSIRSASLHPTSLYESFLDIALMSVILIVNRKTILQNKINIFWIHLGGYSLIRFFLEFLRADRAQIIYPGFSVLQYVMIGIVIFSVAGAILQNSRSSNKSNIF
jgi:phosphatidylglycerol:prolipoprotein diacylglycerol transferase